MHLKFCLKGKKIVNIILPFTFMYSSLLYIYCCIFWPAFECCTHKTLVKICFFNIFVQKTEIRKEKQQNLCKISQKKYFLKLNFEKKNTGWTFYSSFCIIQWFSIDVTTRSQIWSDGIWWLALIGSTLIGYKRGYKCCGCACGGGRRWAKI